MSIRQSTRERIQDFLEGQGFAVYESEPIEDLVTALEVNLEDGTFMNETREEALELLNAHRERPWIRN